ncbi:hypothetical protein [Defluviimonas sp. SAOS-178_SWC]|uniref:hypothetical protein n=1 Tax=Defluviimonas sp. SAOS-178_SWC TaxID=3121287 RepID=UPI003221A17E
MTRRGFLLSSSGLLLSSAVPAVSATFQDDVERRLSREGYRITYKKRTWLGRIRIQAMRGNRRREVVLDPSSGEILRDYIEVTSRGRDSQPADEASEGSSSTGSTGEAGSSPSKEPAKEPTKEPAKEPAKEPTKESASEPSNETSSEPSGETASEPSKETASEPAKEPSKETASEPSKETAGEPSRETGGKMGGNKGRGGDVRK